MCPILMLDELINQLNSDLPWAKADLPLPNPSAHQPPRLKSLSSHRTCLSLGVPIDGPFPTRQLGMQRKQRFIELKQCRASRFNFWNFFAWWVVFSCKYVRVGFIFCRGFCPILMLFVWQYVYSVFRFLIRLLSWKLWSNWFCATVFWIKPWQC